MPPLYDNIVDALVLTQDGVNHSIDLDNTGATMETNEATYAEGFPSLWLKIDLSDPGYTILYETDVPIHLESVADGGSSILPYISIWYVGNVAWDESSPDFSLLHTVSGAFVGDGSATPPSNDFTLDPSLSVTGIFYVFVGDWAGANSGGQTITYAVPPPPPSFTIDTSDYNTISGTVTDLGGGTIEETQSNGIDFSSDFRGVIDQLWTFRIPDAQLPPDGRYQIFLNGQIAGTWSGRSDWFVAIERNGELLLPYSVLTAQFGAGSPSPNKIWRLTGPIQKFGTPLISGQFRYGQGHGPTTIPILAGDDIRFRIYNDSDGSNIQITGITLVLVEAGGHATSINLATMPRDMLNSNEDARDDPTNETEIIQKEMCVLDNGDIYVFYHAQKFISFSSVKNNLKLVKFSGGSWSTVSTDVSHAGLGTNYDPGTSAVPYGQISMCTDGTNLYLAWGETDYTTSKSLLNSSGVAGTWLPRLWHVKKYIPGSGFTEFGTGQCAIPIASRTTSATQDDTVPDCAGYKNSIQIKISPNGTLWVVTGETQDQFYGALKNLYTKPYAYYWNGSSWIDSNLPDPPNIDNTQKTTYMNFIDIDAQHQIDLTFCHSDGPSNYPSIVYLIGGYDSGRGNIETLRFIYAEYNGTSWGNVIDQQSLEIWPNATYLETYGTSAQKAFGHGQQGMQLLDNGSVPILAAALWSSAYLDRVKVAKVNGSVFEEYGPVNSFTIGPDHAFDDNESANSPQQGGGGWGVPTGIQIAIGPDNTPWAILSLEWMLEFNLLVTRFGEPGTEDYWIIGSRNNGLVTPIGEKSTGFAKVVIKNNNIYILATATGIGLASDYMGVIKAPINDPYFSWTSAAIQGGHIAKVTPLGELFILNSPRRTLMKITPDGEMTVVDASSIGNLARIDPDGKITIVTLPT